MPEQTGDNPDKQVKEVVNLAIGLMPGVAIPQEVFSDLPKPAKQPDSRESPFGVNILDAEAEELTDQRIATIDLINGEIHHQYQKNNKRARRLRVATFAPLTAPYIAAVMLFTPHLEPQNTMTGYEKGGVILAASVLGAFAGMLSHRKREFAKMESHAYALGAAVISDEINIDRPAWVTRALKQFS